MDDRSSMAQDDHKAVATTELGATPDKVWQASLSSSETEIPGPGGEPIALLSAEETSHFRSEWERIQTGFVDSPRNAVKDADRLIEATTKRLAESFAGQRTNLEGQWDRSGDVSTEDLRQALQRYRTFFQRLLAV